MSADNWTICPKCEKRIKAEKVRQLKEATDSYGVVSAAEFERLMDKAREPQQLEDTLREDYEIGIYKGLFYVSYSGRCTKCGWQHTFKFEEPIQVR